MSMESPHRSSSEGSESHRTLPERQRPPSVRSEQYQRALPMRPERGDQPPNRGEQDPSSDTYCSAFLGYLRRRRRTTFDTPSGRPSEQTPLLPQSTPPDTSDSAPSGSWRSYLGYYFSCFSDCCGEEETTDATDRYTDTSGIIGTDTQKWFTKAMGDLAGGRVENNYDPGEITSNFKWPSLDVASRHIAERIKKGKGKGKGKGRVALLLDYEHTINKPIEQLSRKTARPLRQVADCGGAVAIVHGADS